MKIYLLLIIGTFQWISVYSQIYDEASTMAGINHTYGVRSPAGGVSFHDFNRDGWDDITLVSYKDSIHFYENQGGIFKRVSLLTVENFTEVKEILWVDYDNDGDSDLFIGSFYGVNYLYQNDGYGNLIDVTAESGLSIEKEPTFGATWGDINNDGWLDLFVTNYYQSSVDKNTNRLYKSNKNGTFSEVSKEAGVELFGKNPNCAAFFDYDNDGYQDIYIAQDFEKGNTLFKNNGDGTFTDVSEVTNSDIKINSMSVTIGDYDNNGFFDIYITNTPQGNKLLKNEGNNTFTEVADDSGVGYYGFGWAANFLDYNNNGLLDLYVSGMILGSDEISSVFYKNVGDGKFIQPNDIGFVGDTVRSFSNAVGDFNNDGFPDIAVNNLAPFNSMLWKNSTNNNKWLKIQLEGKISNRDGIGTLIETYINGQKYSRYTHCGIGYLGQNSQYELIGVGDHDVVDSIKVMWLNGHIDKLYNIQPNQTLLVFEGSTSAKPKIHVNGKDCIFEGDSTELFAGHYKSYSWSTGETSSSIYVDKSGYYFVEVTDFDDNIYGSDTVIISIEEELKIISDIGSSSGGNTGWINIEVIGGTPPYTYDWIGTQLPSIGNVDELIAGVYILNITDSLGCGVSSKIIVPLINGLEYKTNTNPEIHLFPNPVGDFLNIELSQTKFKNELYLKVINLQGQVITSKHLNEMNNVKFYVGSVPAGLYILVGTVNGSDYFRLKFIKE